MEAQHSFGNWLRLKRKALDLTREGLANRVVCSAATIRKIEAEERHPSEQIVHRLAQIFNIPETEYQAFLRFARGDWQSQPAPTGEGEPWQIRHLPTRANLPASSTSLIGREKDIAKIQTDLKAGDIRLITLIGPPGIGKTRLSLEVAHESMHLFPGGVFFVSLASLDDPTLITPTIRTTLGFVEEKNQSPVERLEENIGSQRILLVLDNAEHLVSAVAELTADLITACPRLKILVTSREALRIPGEWLYPVPVLKIPGRGHLSYKDPQTLSNFAAIRLFIERARAVQPDFSLNPENMTAVAEICSQLDGLPLAIELFAARTRLMLPQELLARMRDGFTLHADGTRGRPARQRTLAESIGWSYSLLSEEEKHLFMSLSIFAGGFSLGAAEHMFGDAQKPSAVIERIASLLDKSLLQRISYDRGEVRFHMLLTIQQFGIEMLGEWGQADVLREKHLAYYLELAEKAAQQIHGADQVEWSDLLEIEHENFRAALDYCVTWKKTESAVRLLDALAWPWRMREHALELFSWFEKFRSLPGITTYKVQYARLLNEIGLHNWLMGDNHEARVILEESRSILTDAGFAGERELAETLTSIGIIKRSIERESHAAKTLFEKSLQLYKKYGNQRGIARALFNLGWVAAERDQVETAISLCGQSLAIFQQLGDLWGIGRVSQLFGQVYLQQGEYDKASRFLDQHLRIDEALHFKQGVVIALGNLGNLYRYQGNDERARTLYERSLALSIESGLVLEKNYAYYSLGLIALHQNNFELARKYYILYSASDWLWSDKNVACDILIAFAAIAAATNQPEHAAKLSGAVREILETGEVKIPPFDRLEFERHIRISQESLGEDLFDHWVSEGRSMTMEQAVNYALETVDFPKGSFTH